jgi:hypothetical protein
MLRQNLSIRIIEKDHVVTYGSTADGATVTNSSTQVRCMLYSGTYLETCHLPLQCIQRLRLGVKLDPHIRARLIHQVNGLVREEAGLKGHTDSFTQNHQSLMNAAPENQTDAA